MTTKFSARLPDVDLRQIRPYGSPASRAGGFEEMASILMRDGLVAWPEGTSFSRFGNPDGGREGKGLLPNGDVWAWQAKFLFEFGDSEVSQVRRSVTRVLDSEPGLKRYYVALPYDLPAGDVDTGGRSIKSAYTRWHESRADWETAARDRGMNVEFIYVGAHELLSELTKPHNVARLRYWFDTSLLSPDGMDRRLADVVHKAGRRYTPKLHVEVDGAKVFEALGRTDTYVTQVRIALAALRKARNGGWYPPKGDEAAFAPSIESCTTSLVEAETALEGYLHAAASTGPLPEVVESVRAVGQTVDAVHVLLRDRHLREGRYYSDLAASLYRDCVSTRDACAEALALLRGVGTQAARDGRVLMTGRAGVGKTHLFCDVASRRIASGRPTLVVLGQDFEAGRPLLAQIGELLDLDGTCDEVIGILDAAGEAAGCLAMLMVDAINEAAAAERWEADLRVLAGSVARHPNVVLAVSCRTEFVEPVVGGAIGFPRFEHEGFGDATAQAVERYAQEYNLDRVAFPILNPEYGNALFLKLACEALSTLGQSRFALGAAGLATVCNAFLDAVNVRLAGPSRCDYDVATNLVEEAVRRLAQGGPGPYQRDDVVAITEELLPGRTWSKSLLLGLIREGVLTHMYNDLFAFSYQRLGDVCRAALLAEKPAAEVTAWYRGLGRARWTERGTLGALAVIVPESMGEEIVDLLKEPKSGAADYDVIDAFVQSIVLRSPSHTTDRTVRIAEQLIGMEEWTSRLWDQLVRVSCIPGHRLNADWTHGLLLDRDVATRDLSWSEWLVGSTEEAGFEEERAVDTLLEWGWPEAAEDVAAQLPEEEARLVTLILGWMLATPDRRVRDRATKALVSVGERGTTGFARALPAFARCDDPYVVERLASAACGVVLRSCDAMAIRVVADGAAAMVAFGWPENILTRDYLRRVSSVARSNGWEGPDWLPPYGAEWPAVAMPLDEIEDMNSAPDYRYVSVWHSVHGQFGDFGRYTVDPAIEHFDVPDHRELRGLVDRVIFTRVLELGWTPERFNDVERGRRGGHDGHIERYGKKYQWVAYYEVLGRLADHFQLKERWSDGDPFPYACPEQVTYRDIDPTVLVRGGVPDPSGARPWFAAAAATFPGEVATEYPQDLAGVPDPLELINATSPDGSQWLSLMRHDNWTQELPPEIAALKAPSLNVWVQLRGYLVRSADVRTLRRWAEGEGGQGQDWDGRWMPENADVHSRLLGALPSSPDWDWADGKSEARGFDRAAPVELVQPAAWYGGTGTSRESAGTDEPTGFVPSRKLIELLGLHRGRDFNWTDDYGLAVQDPSAGMTEVSTLLLRPDLIDRLADAGFTLFWTVLLNKLRHDHNYGRFEDDYRWVSASAAYLLDGRDVVRVSSGARLGRAGEGLVSAVDWSLRTR